jgi:hypothetical protein
MVPLPVPNGPSLVTRIPFSKAAGMYSGWVSSSLLHEIKINVVKDRNSKFLIIFIDLYFKSFKGKPQKERNSKILNSI